MRFQEFAAAYVVFGTSFLKARKSSFETSKTYRSDIQEYIAHGGYLALEKVLKQQPQNKLFKRLNLDLEGRGGGGFSTGMKWEIASKVPFG